MWASHKGNGDGFGGDGGDNDNGHDHDNSRDDDNDKDIFITNKVFSSREELVKWTFKKGVENGYVIVTGRSRSSSDKSLGITYVGLVCDRGGKYDGAPVTVKRKSGTKKRDCPFKLEGKYDIRKGGWVLHVKNHKHNHAPSEHLDGHPYTMRFKDEELDMIREMTRQNVKPKVIIGAVRDKFPNNLSSPRTFYNAQAKIKREEQLAADRVPSHQDDRPPSPPPPHQSPPRRVTVRQIPPTLEHTAEQLHLSRQSHEMLRWCVQSIERIARTQSVELDPPPPLPPFIPQAEPGPSKRRRRHGEEDIGSDDDDNDVMSEGYTPSPSP